MIIRIFFLICFVTLIYTNLSGQSVFMEGGVSFTSKVHVYVKFSSTKNINLSDTLYIQSDEKYLPALLVNNKSSGSCVCTRINPQAIFEIGAVIWAKSKNVQPLIPPARRNHELPDSLNLLPVKVLPELAEKNIPKVTAKSIRSFRLSAGSYSTVYTDHSLHRMRYSFSWQGQQIGKSKWSSDVNVVFRHTLREWAAVKENWNSAFKIYALSAIYSINDRNSLVIGRRINPKMASIGAIDGIQYEKKLKKNFIAGAIVGSRPDFADYAINPKLFETGVYIGFLSNTNNRYRQSVIGVMQQMNAGVTDRRFVYAQQNADIAKNINLFASAEVDLFQKINNEASSTVRLTNLFSSINYRASKKLNVNVSYDTRKNVIYYESYKNYIEQLIDFETRQGFRVGFNYRPIRMVSFGGNLNRRFQKSEVATNNINGFVQLNQLPRLNTSLALNFNFLQTGFVQSHIYGMRIYRNFWKNKFNAELFYKYVQYAYAANSSTTRQHVTGASISYLMSKNINFYLYTEKAFDLTRSDYFMLNLRVTHRF